MSVLGKAFRFGVLVAREALHLAGGQGACCRFQPTCSGYFRQALSVHGFGHGTYLGLRRILRCRPGGGWGPDPIPVKKGVRR